MGWTVGWGSGREVRAHLLRDADRVVAHRTTNWGRRLWLLVRPTNGGTDFVALCLVEPHGGAWGYKDMSESCGFYELDCPLDLLDRAGPPPNEYARAWRERVRAHHAARRGRLRPDLREGQFVELHGSRYRITEHGVRPGRRRALHAWGPGGKLYRIGPKHWPHLKRLEGNA